jgi:hypothetical protein
MRPEGCLSDLALDRRLAHELDAREEEAALAHIADCARCGDRFAELARQRDAFATDAPPLVVSRNRSWLAIGAAFAAAAILLFFVVFRGPSDDTRTKGPEANIGFFVNHAGAVRRGGPEERVAPGDGLRFVVTTREPRYLALLSIDGARHASVYYPSSPEAALVGDGPLPESTTLDDTLGDETIHALFCPRAFAVEPLRRALEAAPGVLPALDGCTLDSLHLRKEP